MGGDSTYQGLERLSHMPERSGSQGDRIAGQHYDNVFFTGGNISNVTLENVTIDGGLSTGYVTWIPSDPTGGVNMASELEAFVAANQGYIVRVPDNVTVLLNNAFKLVTTGNVFIDFGKATILYDNQTNNDAAIYLDNTSNASGSRGVSSITNVTVNNDAYVTQLTLSTPLGINRFDWIAFTSSNANPGQSGGVLGEIFQALDDADVTDTIFPATRVLNKFSQYSTGMEIRRLDTTRKVWINGGTFTANGDPESHSITARADGIRIRGYVNPIVQNVVFDRPWSIGVRFVCNAAPRWFNITMQNSGNLANYNGFTYGVSLYGMNDSADGRQIVTKNCRHSAFTTDGDSNNTTSWFLKGIPTNFVVDGVHGINCNASVVDTHAEGDGGHITNVSSYFQYQDADISPNFSGCTAQLRCSNTRISNVFCFGGTNGIKVTAIDHGFEDKVFIDNVFIMNTTSSNDTDIGINIFDQSSLTNKRKVFLSNAKMTNVGKAVFIGKTAIMDIHNIHTIGCDTAVDCGEGSSLKAKGAIHYDFSNNTRTPAYHCNDMRSNAPNGGATAIYLSEPIVTRGDAANEPAAFFTQHDTTANKTYWAPSVIDDNPNGVTALALVTAGATTMVQATTVTRLEGAYHNLNTALTVSTTTPSSPSTNDIWIDTN